MRKRYKSSPSPEESLKIARRLRSLKKLRGYGIEKNFDPSWAGSTYDAWRAEGKETAAAAAEPPPSPADEDKHEEVFVDCLVPETRQVAYATTEDGDLAHEIAGLLMKRTGHGDTLTIKGVHSGYSLSLIEPVEPPSFAEFFSTILGEAFGLRR